MYDKTQFVNQWFTFEELYVGKNDDKNSSHYNTEITGTHDNKHTKLIANWI